MPAFNNRLVDKVGKWKDLLDSPECKGEVFLSRQRCSSMMASTHIAQDLTFALTQHGCFSDDDWNKLFDQIDACIEDKFDFFSESVASFLTESWRNDARAACCDARAGDPGCR